MVAEKTSRLHLVRADESPIGVSVRPYIGGSYDKPQRLVNNLLDIRDDGMILGVPGNISGFQLNVLVPRGSIVCQRDRETNEYYSLAAGMDRLSDSDLEYRQMVIKVHRNSKFGFFTLWRDNQDPRSSNNVAIWEVEPNGHVTMWEVGVLSPNGRDFYIAHDIRWDGYMREMLDPQRYDGDDDTWIRVGIPSDPKYGSFRVRQDILDYEPFMAALPKTLLMYEGTEEDLEVRLAPPSEPNVAIIDWWHQFMGMGLGQGICLLPDGQSAWLLGQDVEGLNPDRPVQLERGQLVELIARPNGKIVVNDMGKTPRIIGARLLP